MKRLLFITWLCILIQMSSAQEPFQVGFGVSKGWIADNGPLLKQTPHYPLSVVLDLSRPIVSDSYWVQYWKYPRYGVRATWMNMPDTLAGQMFGLDAFLEGPFLKSFHWMIGLGLSLYTNPYSRTPNPDNIFIGSYINCLIEGGIGYTFDLGNRSSLQINGAFLHTSNGYLKKPNKGLNFWQIGLYYRLPSTEPSIEYEHTSPTYNNAVSTPLHKVYLSYGSGIVQSRLDHPDKNYYYGWTAMAGYLYRIHPCFSVGADLDFSMNTSRFQHIKVTGDNYSLPCYIGLYATTEAYWGNLALRISCGTEPIRARHIGDNSFSERVGLYYHFGKTRDQWAGLGMKLYWAKVDFLELTYAITLFDK